MQAGGVDSMQVLKMWNSNVPQSARVVGVKRVGLTSLLGSQVPAKGRQLLIDIVSRYGVEGSPFHDEAWGSKKLYPGLAQSL